MTAVIDRKHAARPALRRLLCSAMVVTGALFAASASTQARPEALSAAVINVTAGKPTEFRFELSVKSVKHQKVTFKVTNKGQLSHDFKICSSPKGGKANSCPGKSTPLLAPGKSATLIYSFAKAGTYEYLCTVPGHAAAGMKGDLKVT